MTPALMKFSLDYALFKKGQQIIYLAWTAHIITAHNPNSNIVQIQQWGKAEATVNQELLPFQTHFQELNKLLFPNKLCKSFRTVPKKPEFFSMSLIGHKIFS